jgi:hypothetical protein
MDADIAAYLRALAERVHRNVPLRHNPERFHVEKACIAQDLELLAQWLEDKAERDKSRTITITGTGRPTRVALQRNRDPFL